MSARRCVHCGATTPAPGEMWAVVHLAVEIPEVRQFEPIADGWVCCPLHLGPALRQLATAAADVTEKPS